MSTQTKRRSPRRPAIDSLNATIALLRGLPTTEVRKVHEYLRSIGSRSGDEAVIMTSLPESSRESDLVIRIPAAFKSGVLTAKTRDAGTIVVVEAKPTSKGPRHFLDALNASEKPEIDSNAHAEMEHRFETFRKNLIAHSWPSKKVADHLKITREAIRQRLAAKQLFGIKVGRSFLFPSWQFSNRFSSGVLPGLADVLNATILDDVDLASWFTSPQSSLGQRTPIQALTAKDVNDVVTAAHAAGLT